MATTDSDWIAKLEDDADRSTAMTASADTIQGAIAAAWNLQRMYEAPVLIIDNRDDEPRVAGRLNLEWIDE